MSHVILSDGVVIEYSTRANNRTGFTGAAISPSWTLDNSKPFIAACGNPTDPVVMSEVVAQQRTSLHLGHYADSREAAYVVAKYKQDPITVIREVQNNGSWVDFPEDLYTLQEVLTHSDAVDLIQQSRIQSKNSGNTVKISKKVITPKVDNRPARDAYFEKYNHDTSKQLWAKFGRDLVRREFDILTINEFELRYGLA